MRKAELHTSYRILMIRTVSDDVDPDAPSMDPGEGDLVTLFPGLGAVITTRSTWGPVDLTVVVGSHFTMYTSPSLGPHGPFVPGTDQTWTGKLILRDKQFHVMSFDDQPDDMRFIDAGSAGEHQMTVDWRYTEKPPDSESFEDYDEHVIIQVH